MAKSNGNKGGLGFLKYPFAIVIFLLILLVVYFLWNMVTAAGYGQSPEKIIQERNAAIKANKALAAKNQQLETQQKGISNIAVWIFLVAALAAFVVINETTGSVSGKNINYVDARRLAEKLISDPKHLGYVYFNSKDALNTKRHWYRVTSSPGQATEGDIGSLWYVFEFAKMWPNGIHQLPDNLAITVGIKSSDAARQIHIEDGLNARSFCKLHNIKIQKNAQPAILAQELNEISAKLGIAELAERARRINND